MEFSPTPEVKKELDLFIQWILFTTLSGMLRREGRPNTLARLTWPDTVQGRGSAYVRHVRAWSTEIRYIAL